MECGSRYGPSISRIISTREMSGRMLPIPTLESSSPHIDDISPADSISCSSYQNATSKQSRHTSGTAQSLQAGPSGLAQSGRHFVAFRNSLWRHCAATPSQPKPVYAWKSTTCSRRASRQAYPLVPRNAAHLLLLSSAQLDNTVQDLQFPEDKISLCPDKKMPSFPRGSSGSVDEFFCAQ